MKSPPDTLCRSLKVGWTPVLDPKSGLMVTPPPVPPGQHPAGGQHMAQPAAGRVNLLPGT